MCEDDITDRGIVQWKDRLGFKDFEQFVLSKIRIVVIRSVDAHFCECTQLGRDEPPGKFKKNLKKVKNTIIGHNIPSENSSIGYRPTYHELKIITFRTMSPGFWACVTMISVME